MNMCKLCGRPVVRQNDALLMYVVQLLLRGQILMAADMTINGVSVHLLPEGDCEGARVLAQYLPGQPRIENPQDPGERYIEGLEELNREAYRRMLEWDGENMATLFQGTILEQQQSSNGT